MKRLLVVVDYQKDFVDGPLGFPGAERLLPRIDRLIEEFEKAGDDVVFTRDVHHDNYLHTEEGRNLPVPHCLSGTEGAKFYGDIEERALAHPVFEKETFPCLALADYLRKENYREIVLCGLDSSMCVLSNAIIAKAADADAHIVVDLSASDCGDAAAKEAALIALKRLEVEIRDTETTRGII
jgi:nicotinamidase/pyrazinamidase